MHRRDALPPVPAGWRAWIPELMLTAALIVLTAGLWRWCGPGALTAPGLVLTWLLLPTRRAFVEPSPAPVTPKRDA